MAATFVLIGTVSGSATSLTFSSIPQTYKDLVVIGNCCSAFNGDSVNSPLRINGLSTSIYNYMALRGTAASVLNTSSVNADGAGNDAMYFFNNAWSDTTLPSQVVARFFDYTNTTRNKTILIRSNVNGGTFSSSVVNGTQVGTVGTTNAITSITFTSSSGTNWTSTTSFNLYGLASS